MVANERISSAPAILVLLIGLTSLLPGGLASAQGCFAFVEDFSYSPSNCSAQPEIDRVFRLQAITWKEHKYLFVDEGNELKIFNIDNPLSPVSTATSHFNIPNFGDSDYDMESFTVCDDCRYGVANFKLATVLFDLGTGSVPYFVDEHKNYDADLVWGSFTFSNGSQQYLVAATLGTNPCPNNKSGLYRFYDVNHVNNPRLQCLENGGTGPTIINGISVANTNPPVFYMADNSFFRIYTLQTSPTVQLNYEGNAGIDRINMARGDSVAVDAAAGLVAMAWGDEVKIYDIGYGSGSAVNPILLSTTALQGLNTASRAALKYPILHVSEPYSADEPETWDVSNPSNPVSLDQQFWDPSHAWNNLGVCVLNNDAVFSDDGGAMYLARYSSLQVIDPTACSGSVAPLANLALSPQPVFPGDSLTVTNTSLSGDEYATWITDGANPHGSTVLWPPGGISFSTGNLPLNYILPGDMASGDVFYAHAAVQNESFPYVPGSTPDQIKTQPIIIDRSPEAAITITPPAVVTGGSVSLTAVAEGHPAVPGGGDPYAWTVTPPVGAPTQYQGSQVNDVVLDPGGQWTFELVVRYAHDVIGQPGVPYSDTVQVIKNISSVSASFTISPTAPLYNETITLASNSAALTGATLDFDWDVLQPNTPTVLYELSSCDGVHPVDSQCVLPPETLDWGFFDFRLTLTNTGNSDQDTALIEDFGILIGYPQLDFSWTPTSPEIGQWVGFQITGVPESDIEQASWDFGGSGCDGASQFYTCVPGLVPCDLAAFAYSTGGSKTVRLTVTTTGGVSQPQVTHTLTVQNTGSCSGGSCTYGITPATRNFTGAGGSGTINVSTQSGCTWGAFESSSWISITSGSSGSGSGTVTYQVAANTGEPRSAIIVAAGRSHTVTQDPLGPCEGGDVHDDGTAENGYGWGHGSNLVQRFTPASYPYVYTDVCVAFTQAGGDPNLSFDVLILDDDGPGGGPGTALASIPAVAAGVPAWMNHSFFSVDVEGASPAIEDGSVYIGVGWDDASELGFFVAADESLGTPQQTGYFSSDGSTWEAIANTFSGYKSLLVRTDGFSTVDGEWTQVVGSISGGGNGFGDWANFVARSAAVFAGGLFVGTDNSYGGEVNLTLDGETWVLGNTPGFGDPSNDGISSLTRFGGFLYAATLNPVFGTQVWRTAIPLSWNSVESDGFGDSFNQSAPSGQVFDGFLYLGTKHSAGCEIWRTQDGVAWSQVHSNGFGNLDNRVAESMAVFRGELYVGTRNSNGAELWRSPDGVIWFPAMTGGFGSAESETITGLVVFENALYIGVSNALSGAQVWRTSDGTSWEQLVDNGFGNVGNTVFDAFAVGDQGLSAAVSGPSNQGLIWKSTDGVVWTQSSSPGFSDPENTSIGALQYWSDRVYAGTANPAAGCQVWRSDRHPVFEDGFESGGSGAWSAVVP